MTHLRHISSKTHLLNKKCNSFQTEFWLTDKPATTFSRGWDVQWEMVGYTAASTQSDSLWNRYSRGRSVLFCFWRAHNKGYNKTNKAPIKLLSNKMKKMGKVSQISLGGVLAVPSWKLLAGNPCIFSLQKKKNPHLEHLYIWRAITTFKIIDVYHYYQSDYVKCFSISQELISFMPWLSSSKPFSPDVSTD